jgi:hypothetical protein
MNREMGFSFEAPVSDGACLRHDPRGARHWGASSRRKLVSGRSVWILAMMQSCASAAKLRAAGPFSPSASVPCQLPVPATSDRQSAVRPERQRERRIAKKMLFPEAFQPAGRKMTPSNVSPVVTKRQSAISSLRAMATIIVLRVPARLSAVRARYHNASALSF